MYRLRLPEGADIRDEVATTVAQHPQFTTAEIVDWCVKYIIGFKGATIRLSAEDKVVGNSSTDSAMLSYDHDLSIFHNGDGEMVFPLKFENINGDFNVFCANPKMSEMIGLDMFPSKIAGGNFRVENITGIKSFEGYRPEFSMDAAPGLSELHLSFILPELTSLKGIDDMLSGLKKGSSFTLYIKSGNKVSKDEADRYLELFKQDPRCKEVRIDICGNSAKPTKAPTEVAPVPVQDTFVNDIPLD